MVCEPDNHWIGSSRLEYAECKDGIEWWKCLDCGETIQRYHDAGCGGEVEVGLLSCLFISCLLLMFLGFFAGRRYEKQYWTKFLPEQMSQLCIECAGMK